MNPVQIIRQATAEGVSLALSPAGTIKAIGKDDALARWLPVLQGRKSEIVQALRERAQPNLTPNDVTMLVRRWLAQIGETDPLTIEQVLDQCRGDAEARAYFLKRAKEIGT